MSEELRAEIQAVASELKSSMGLLLSKNDKLERRVITLDNKVDTLRQALKAAIASGDSQKIKLALLERRTKNIRG